MSGERKTLGQLRDEQVAQAYEDGRKAERECILARARRMNYGPTLRRFCRDISRGCHEDEEWAAKQDVSAAGAEEE